MPSESADGASRLTNAYDTGVITTFDMDGNIYHQAAYGNIVNPNRDIHTDFKIPYTDEIISNEENKLEEIANQVRNG